MAAIKEIKVPEGSKGDGGEADEITGHQVMQLLYGWSDDLRPVQHEVRQMFKSGVAMVEGVEKLTSPLQDKLSVDDFDGLMGAYIANFIAPSLMGE